jgi:hypothetical protein
LGDGFFDFVDQEGFVFVGRDGGQGRVFAVDQLVRPGQECEGGAGESGML